MIVGISGYARTGKDTVAKFISEFYNFKHVAFANKLRDCLYALNPLVDNNKYLREVIDSVGWNGYKETEWYLEIRRLLQRFGTEVGRDLLHPDIWINSTLNSHEDLVVSDVRFKNEVDAIKNIYDGYIIRINRPGVGPVNNHSSDTLIDTLKVDYIINNDGGIYDLQDKIHLIMEKIWK